MLNLSWNELPEECWEIVIDRLNQQNRHRCLESVSLVSKRFLFISNRLRSRIRITGPRILDHRSVSGLLRRFHQLKRIDLDEFDGDGYNILQEIACSELSLEGLNLANWGMISRSLKIFGVNKNLKILICSRLCFLGDNDLDMIAISFPNLEELDISYSKGDYDSLERDHVSGLHLYIVTDAGIELLASLRNLCKINISGTYFITDRSLRAISKNFEFLKEITAVDCGFLTEDGLTNFIRYKSNLVSVVMGTPREPVEIYPTLPIEESIIYAKDLQVLSFSEMAISMELILSINKANLPLQKLVLSCCNGLSSKAIFSLLCKYQSLNYLDLEGARFLTDFQLEHLSMYFYRLSFIGLNSCSKLTFATFFTLAKNCSFLEEIQMERTGLGKESWHTDPRKNSRIQSLKLAGNKFLGYKCLTRILSACPNLVSLDVSNCSNITEQGIQEIGKNCSKLSELEVNGCRRIRNIGALGILHLEVLRAKESGINDKGLQMVGRRCAELLCLDLEGCLQVSDRGVKEVVGSCKRLREVSLKNCGGVSVDVVTWMVLSGPTLRKINPPPGFRRSEEQEDLFLRQGCMVYHG